MNFMPFLLGARIGESLSDSQNGDLIRELEDEANRWESYAHELELERDQLIVDRNNLLRENDRLRAILADFPGH